MKSTRPSPALVVAILALIVALGGSSYAALKIPKNSVGTKQLKKNAVGTKQLKKQAVKSQQIKKRSIKGNRIADNTIGSDQIAANSIGTGQLANGSVGAQQLALSSVGAPQLADNSVDTAALQNASVTAAKIAPGALDHSVVVRTFITNAIGNGGLGEAEANCNAGELLIGGGGGWVNNSNPATSFQLSGTISDSSPSAGSDTPSADGAAPQLWHVSGRNTTGGNARMLAYATCLS